MQRLQEEQAHEGEAAAFALELVRGVQQRRDELDHRIRRFAPLFPVEQLSIIDRTLLRLAIYEVLFSQKTPPKVAINEAVELAKLFGSESSPRFINGVLGSVMEDLQESGAAPTQTNREAR